MEVKFQQQGSVAWTFIACCAALRHGRVAFAFKQYFSRKLHDLEDDMDVQMLEDVSEPVTRLRVHSPCKFTQDNIGVCRPAFKEASLESTFFSKWAVLLQFCLSGTLEKENWNARAT